MPHTNTSTLRPTQRLILTEAARQPQQRILRPETTKPPTFRAGVQALKKRGLIAAVRPAEGERVRRGCLVITDNGLAALGLVPPTVVPEEPASSEAAEVAPAKRRGTKQDLLLALLTSAEGATLEALSAATQWLPHTTRAALTRLRQRGLAIITERVAGQSTRYRLARPDAASAGETVA